MSLNENSKLQKILKRIVFSPFLTVGIGMIVLVITTTIFFREDVLFPQSRVSLELIASLNRESQLLRLTVMSLLQELDSLQSIKLDTSTHGNTNTKQLTSSEFRMLKKTLTDIVKRLSNLEDAIGDNPSRAVQTILLRKDLDNLKNSNQADILMVKQEIERVYDWSKWIAGSLFLLAFGILSLAATNIFKGRKIE